MQKKIKKTNDASVSAKDTALTNVRAFMENESFLGLPLKAFTLGFVLSLSFGYLLYWSVGILFGLIYFYGMLSIHKDDKQGFSVWRDAFIRSIRNKNGQWDTALTKSTKLIILTKVN